MNIKLVKLVTGDELIADVETAGESLKLKNVRRFYPTQEGVHLLPLSLFTDDDVDIFVNFNQIVFFTNLSDEAAAIYRQHISGVIVPEKKIII